MFYVNIDGVNHPSDNLPPNSNNNKTIERRERRKRSKRMSTWTSFTGEPMEYTVQPKDHNKSLSGTNFCLAPLPKQPPAPQAKAVPRTSIQEWVDMYVPKQEGKTPMRNTFSGAYASVDVTPLKSDTETTRDYLLNRLEIATYPKRNELHKLFNIGVDNSPKTYKELIDIIKNDKYTIDAKIAKRLDAEEEQEIEDIYWGSTYGIIWPGPVEDLKGYRAAMTEMDKQATAARDVIMTDASAALKALQAFEAWLPSVTVH